MNPSYARLTSTGTLSPAIATVSLRIASQASFGALTNVNAFAIFMTAPPTIFGTLIHAVANAFPKIATLTSTGTKIFASACVSIKTVLQAKSGIQMIANVGAFLSKNAQLDFYGMTFSAYVSAHKLKNAHQISTGIQSTADACASQAVPPAFLQISGTP